MMKCIVAVDKNFGIGYKGKLLFSIPEDMKFFKETTMDSLVVMGRNTYDSIGKPLKNRTNIVITSRFDLRSNEDLITGTFEEMERIIAKYREQDVFIIGGGEIYNHYIDKCDQLLITEYDRAFMNVDTYFPNPADHGFKKDAKIKEGIYEYYKYEITSWIK